MTTVLSYIIYLNNKSPKSIDMKAFNIYSPIFLSIIILSCSPKSGQVTSDPKQDAQSSESFRSEAPKAGPAPLIQIGDYEQFEMANGLQVIVVENHKIPRVSWQLFVDVPPTSEGEKVGVSDMAGELLRTGTTTKTKADIDKAIDFIGARINTNARGVYAASLSKHQDKLLEVVQDIVLNPSFPESEFEKLRRQTISGLAQAKTDPNSLVSQVGDVILYGEDHPYGELQTESKVNNITVEDARSYYETYFYPNISYLVVVGDITAEAAKAQAEKYFGSWGFSQVPEMEDLDIPESPGERAVSFINKDGAVQSVVRLAFPYQLTPGHPDAIKVSVMNTLLGGFFNSRVNLNLREDKGYTYGAGTSMGTDKYVASFTGTTSVRNEVTDSSIYEFLNEMEILRNESVGEDELDLVKSVVMGNFALSLESAQTVANFALNTARYNLPEDYYRNYLKKVSEITAEDIQMMAQKYLQPDDLHIIVVGDESEVAEKLLEFDDCGEIDYYDTDGNLLEKTAIALPADVDPNELIEDYLRSLGEKDKRDAIRSLETVYTMDAMGNSLEMAISLVRPDKFFMSVSMQGMQMSTEVMNGDKGVAAQMGQEQALEGEMLDNMRAQAAVFEEEYYLQNGHNFELKSIENIDGKPSYKLAVSDGEKVWQTIFIDQESKLKVRTVETQDQNGQTVTITEDFKDYKEVEGVLFPHTIVTSGVFPVPITATLKSIKVNPEIDYSIFQIEE
jgi:zinc protease